VHLSLNYSSPPTYRPTFDSLVSTPITSVPPNSLSVYRVILLLCAVGALKIWEWKRESRMYKLAGTSGAQCCFLGQRIEWHYFRDGSYCSCHQGSPWGPPKCQYLSRSRYFEDIFHSTSICVQKELFSCYVCVITNC